MPYFYRLLTHFIFKVEPDIVYYILLFLFLAITYIAGL